MRGLGKGRLSAEELESESSNYRYGLSKQSEYTMGESYVESI